MRGRSSGSIQRVLVVSSQIASQYAGLGHIIYDFNVLPCCLIPSVCGGLRFLFMSLSFACSRGSSGTHRTASAPWSQGSTAWRGPWMRSRRTWRCRQGGCPQPTSAPTAAGSLLPSSWAQSSGGGLRADTPLSSLAPPARMAQILGSGRSRGQSQMLDPWSIPQYRLAPVPWGAWRPLRTECWRVNRPEITAWAMRPPWSPAWQMGLAGESMIRSFVSNLNHV